MAEGLNDRSNKKLAGLKTCEFLFALNDLF